MKTLMLGAAVAALSTGVSAQTIGFSQIGSESGWRAAETTVPIDEHPFLAALKEGPKVGVDP